MGEDYGYQDPEVEIKESGDVDFVEFADSIADGKDHSVTFYDIAPEGSVMLVYNYDHAQDKLEVISYDENYTEETLYVREHGDVTAGSIENISAFTENHFRDTFQKIERDEDIPIISMETPEIEEEPMDFQTLLDLEHSQNDEMEEQQNQEIDFGEQQDGIPDERYEGMTSYEEDDLSFLPTAEENMMAEVLSVEGEKPEYVVENPDVHADYGMDKLSPDGQKAIAEAMDKSVMTPLASGFIDFELREGFRGNTDGLTSDDISKLREHDPGFGKIIGIDTTKFYTSGPEKNVTIIKLDYEDIKPALSIDQKGFEKENIVPGSIRAYKEFGQSMKVDGMRFGVTNLVTFEAKLKGEDLPYRTTCVMDDSGRVRGFLEVQEPDRRIPMDLQAKLDAAPGTETHFASLDRTDPENRACIPGLRNATPEIREAFFDKVEAKMPEFMEKFCDNMKEDFLERKDALIAKLDEAKQERDIVHIDLNKVELVRENVLSELADARTGMQDIAEDMNDVMLGYYPVNNKINDVDVKLNREDISKEEKESLEKERADYVKEREEIDQKLDDMKPGFVERYNDYLKISERSELPALDRLSETLSESFLNANGRVEALSMYLERIYGADVDDGEGNLSKTRIMDGLEYGTEFHGEPRFQMVCAWEGQKETLPYQGTFKEYLKENPDLFTEIDSRLEKIVDAYNETAPDTDKITIGEDGQPYTKDGILVEAVTTGKHEDFPKNELSDTYKVGGDNFYKVDGAITIPRGTITIQETKAPDGYRNDLNMTDTKGNSTVNGVYLAQVTKPGDLSTLMGGQTFEGSDSPVRADIKLTKINGTNNNTMANIPFKITNLETKESHTIYTGSNGVYDSSLIKKSLNTNTDKAGAGVWFGDTSILNDDEGSFEYGSYSIEELECKENNGKILYKGTFKIDNNTGGTLDLGKIINNSIEVKTYAADNTSGNNNTAFIQQGGIFNYTTGQLTYGKAITDEVNVKGISSGYAVANLVDIETGEYIKNKDGSIVQSEAKIEPYNDGTYTGQAHQNLVYDNPESMLGKNIVVFEKIYALNADGTPNYNKLLVEHTDMNDDLQTVKFQKISTELTVSDTGLHEVNTTSKDVTLQDQITYENFSRESADERSMKRIL